MKSSASGNSINVRRGKNIEKLKTALMCAVIECFANINLDSHETQSAPSSLLYYRDEIDGEQTHLCCTTSNPIADKYFRIRCNSMRRIFMRRAAVAKRYIKLKLLLHGIDYHFFIADDDTIADLYAVAVVNYKSSTKLCSRTYW